MIVRIEIEGSAAGVCSYRVAHEGESLYDDAGLDGMADCLVAAVEGLPPGVVGVEVWYQGVVSGTYPLAVLALNLAQIASHAVNTTAAIEEALGAAPAL